MKKNTILFARLSSIFGDKMNLTRLKFFGKFICALCKVQTVCFEKLATAFDTDVKTDSSLRRIQRFMAEYMLDTKLIARFVFSLLPHEPSYRLTMDRTNWKFGTSNINILVLAVVYQGVAFPILYKMMPKFGNSSTSERIGLMEDFIELFGADCIDCLLADREFVGDNWLGYLNWRKIQYHIRIRNNFWEVIPKNGKRVKASWLFGHIALNQFLCTLELCMLTANFAICQLQRLSIVMASRSFRSLFLLINVMNRIHYTTNDGRLNLHLKR